MSLEDNGLVDGNNRQVLVGTGMPQSLWLDAFGLLVHDAFDAWPYLVGSALYGKTWRDVDVRLMLSDDLYAKLKLGDPRYPHQNKRWISLVLAYSALGTQMTGLPIDFQIQQQTYGNEQCVGAAGRSALGLETALAHQSTSHSEASA